MTLEGSFERLSNTIGPQQQHDNMKKFLSFFFVLTLSACSGVKVTYNQLDWVIPEYADSYMPLSAEQEDALQQHVHELLAWHCTSELKNYSAWLRRVSADVRNQELSYATLVAHHRTLDRYWAILAQRVSLHLTQVLASATDEQIEQLFKKIDEDNEDFKNEYVDRPPKQIRQDYERWMTKRLKRWFGSLTDEQEALISQWREEMWVLGSYSYQARLRWQRAFREVLDDRQHLDEFTTHIETLLVAPQHYWSPTYREKYEHNRALTMQLIATLAQTLNQKQTKHFTKRANGWADDFDDLACTAASA